jgi:hypothetical protein
MGSFYNNIVYIIKKMSKPRFNLSQELSTIDTPETRKEGAAWLENSIKRIKSTTRRITWGGIIVSLFLFTWVLVFTFLLLKPGKDVDDRAHQKYFATHRLWFGEESIILIIWNIWYYALLLIVLGPILMGAGPLVKSIVKLL